MKQKMPTAFLKEQRGEWAAWGIHPETQRRKLYYSESKEGASRKAFLSFYPELVDRPETLNDYYAESYLPTIVHRSGNWKSQVGWAMDKYVRPVFGKTELKNIDRSKAQRFFNSLIGPLEVSSVRRIRIVFSAVLNLAEQDDRIRKNPVRSVKLPEAEEPEKIALTYEQVGKLIYHAEERLLPVLYISLVAGGLRIGETCAMNRQLVTKTSLKVDQQVLQQKGGAIVTKRLKTKWTRRTIPIPEALGEKILNCHQKSRTWVCSNVDAGYLLPNNVNLLLAQACALAKIPKITPHEMRHTFISLLENELEAPTPIVAALAGKAHKSVTSGYSHTHKAQLLKWVTRHFETVVKHVEYEAEYQKVIFLDKVG